MAPEGRATKSRRPRIGPSPPLAFLLAEGPRAFLETLTLPASSPWLGRAPRGDGHPVLVLPGFAAGDGSTRVLRRYLRGLGYHVHAWGLGRNLGVRGPLRERLRARVEGLHARYGRRLSLVGWSLGGIYAREIAKQMPGRVRQVVTLGSPFADVSWGSNATGLFGWFSETSRHRRSHLAARLRTAPGVPSTAIYSRSDGVVHWRSCLEPENDHTENIEVPGSHCGLGFNPLVLFAVADRLSQPEGGWQPFERRGWRRHVYR